jgi:hypothetical protein
LKEKEKRKKADKKKKCICHGEPTLVGEHERMGIHISTRCVQQYVKVMTLTKNKQTNLLSKSLIFLACPA